MADLLGEDALVAKNALYRCLDQLLPHKAALFSHLRTRWQDLFATKLDVLLYDLTSTYFGSPPPDVPNVAEAGEFLRDPGQDRNLPSRTPLSAVIVLMSVASARPPTIACRRAECPPT
jgi:hypothetical protein